MNKTTIKNKLNMLQSNEFLYVFVKAVTFLSSLSQQAATARHMLDRLQQVCLA